MLNYLLTILSNITNNKYYLLIANVGYMHFILINYIIIYLYGHIFVLLSKC